MQKDPRSRLKRPGILSIVSSVLFGVWVLGVLNTRSAFQNSARFDALAMIHVLFPWFWILLSVFALLCFVVFRLKREAMLLNVLLLCQLSLFLYFTPFVLSGFSWSPDSLWHGGIASYTSEVLKGSDPVYSTYVESYPFSFLTTYFVEQISGLNVFEYTLYVYPLICIVSTTILAYTFSSRLFGSRRAFLSMLIALPALHFIEPHVSPFSAGTMLVLATFLLLTMKSRAARILSFFAVVALTLTHPISPISLGIYIFAAILVEKLSKRAYGPEGHIYDVSGFGSRLMFLAIVWFLWTMYHSMSVYSTVEYAISDVFTLRFLDRLLYVSEWTTGGQGFIFSEIHELNLEIYAVFLIFICILMVRDLSKVALKKRRLETYVTHKRIVLALSSISYAAFGYILFLATGQRFLLGRGLIFYILTGSICVCTYFVHEKYRKISFEEASSTILVLFLLVTFPIISYSKEAYNTFTPSAGYGLDFIASNINLSERSISIGNDQQLAAYVNLSKEVLIEKYPPPPSHLTADIIVLRINSYFVRAMRIDFSFENNGYTQLQDALKKSIGYDIIYSSPTFKVYSSNFE